MEKIIAGKVTLFREKCFQCGEYNLSGNRYFTCTACGIRYDEDKIKKIRILALAKRKQMPRHIRKELLKIQGNRCFWCGRKFGLWYKTKQKQVPKQLEAVGDHQIPYNYCQRNPDDNWCLSCNICNSMKSDLIFTMIDDCRNYLQNRWNKRLEKSEIILL